MLVVILIIGILASVALPQYEKAVAKARATEAFLMVRKIMEHVKLCSLEKGDYCSTPEALETFDAPSPIRKSGCYDDGICFNTKNWSYNASDLVYVVPIVNGTPVHDWDDSNLVITVESWELGAYCMRVTEKILEFVPVRTYTR